MLKRKLSKKGDIWNTASTTYPLLPSPKKETLDFIRSASPQRPRKGIHMFLPIHSACRPLHCPELAPETADPSLQITG